MIHVERGFLTNTRPNVSFNTRKMAAAKPCSVRLTYARLSRNAGNSRKGSALKSGNVGFVCAFSDATLKELELWPEVDLLTSAF